MLFSSYNEIKERTMGSLKHEVKNYIVSRSASLNMAIRKVKEREKETKVAEHGVIDKLEVRLDELNNMAANFGIKLK